MLVILVEARISSFSVVKYTEKRSIFLQDCLICSSGRKKSNLAPELWQCPATDISPAASLGLYPVRL